MKTLSLAVRVGVGAQIGHRSAEVYTPDVADQAALPVLYLLHGDPGAASNFCSTTAAATLNAQFRRGVRPFVVVCPDGNSSSIQDTEWADSSDGRIGLETFVTGELRLAVEGDHQRLRAMRAIGGFSMGGFGAASIALRHPDLYGQVVGVAGYFHIDDPDGVFGAAPAAHDPTRLVGSGSGQRWLLVEAEGDGLALTAHDSERFAPLLRRAGAAVTLYALPGAHTLKWATGVLPDVARFLGAGWGQP